MEIVIKIPDKIYKFVQNTSFVENESTLFKQTSAERQKTLFLFDILDAIKNGTPLPEHHGRLIDKDKMIADLLTVDPRYKKEIDWCVRITDAQLTIIEGSESE